MKKPKTTSAHAARVHAFADKLAAELGDLVDEHVDDLLDRARTYTVDKLRADIAGERVDEPDDEEEDEPAPTPPPVKRAPRVSKAAKPEPPAKAAGPACSKCGQPGHNARSCGREPKGSGKTEPAPSRYDLIAKRAGTLPTPSFSTHTDDD